MMGLGWLSFRLLLAFCFSPKQGIKKVLFRFLFLLWPLNVLLGSFYFCLLDIPISNF